MLSHWRMDGSSEPALHYAAQAASLEDVMVYRLFFKPLQGHPQHLGGQASVHDEQ
jgi:hypothetical protein